MAKRRPPNNFKPVVVYDRMGYVKQLQLAADAEGEDVILLVSDTTRYDLFTRDVLSGQIGETARYAVSEKDPKALALHFKERALTYGATPEAIRLLGLLCPLTQEEEYKMASAKLAPKADKEGLKNAAKAAPVGGKKEATAPKARGNPEALAKARETANAKLEEQKKDKRKIVLTDKGKEKLKKGGESNAVAELTTMRDSKTVGGAVTAGLGMSAINYAVKSGTIELN